MARSSAIGLAFLLVILAVTAAWAVEADKPPAKDNLTDWAKIPDFTIEAALGVAVDEKGELVGESATFPANVGTVFCRMSLIGIEQPQTVTVVWYREDEEVSRTKLRLSKEHPRDTASLAIPATKAGSWRVELLGDSEEVLSVLPFVVSKPSAPTNEEPKKAPKP